MSRAVPRFRRINAQLPLITNPAYRITVFYLCDQQICLWTIDYIAQTNTQTSSSEENIANNFNTALIAAIRGALSSDCNYTQVKVQCLTTPSRIPAIVLVAAANQAGTVIGTHLPLEMAAIISKQSFTKGQHGRGRLYLPGIPSSFVTPATDANRLNTVGGTAVAQIATAIFAAGITDAGNLMIASVTTRVLQGAPTTRGQALSTSQVRSLLGTVRRRRIGRGK